MALGGASDLACSKQGLGMAVWAWHFWHSTFGTAVCAALWAWQFPHSSLGMAVCAAVLAQQFGQHFFSFWAAVCASRLSRKGAATHHPCVVGCVFWLVVSCLPFLSCFCLFFFFPSNGLQMIKSHCHCCCQQECTNSNRTSPSSPGRTQLSRPLAAGRT